METQFTHYFEMAERMPGITGENLLVLLERRLDSMVYRLGFASSIAQARQIVRHGHIEVDNKPVTVPSYLLDVGEVVSVVSSSRTKKVIVEAIEMSQRRGSPSWMTLERDQFRGSMRALPTRADLTMPDQRKADRRALLALRPRARPGGVRGEVGAKKLPEKSDRICTMIGAI